MRLMELSGYMPDLLACRHCGAFEAEIMRLSLTDGTIICNQCQTDSDKDIPLTASALKAMRHTIYADLEKLFSFSLSGQSEKLFLYAAEQYVRSHSPKPFATLEFYHSMKSGC